MAFSVTSTGSVVSTVTRPTDSSSQIASLQKTLQGLEKQLTQASASGSSATSTQLVQLLSQEISLVESQISQLLQPSAPAPAQLSSSSTRQAQSKATTDTDKPSAAQRQAAEADREKRAKATAQEAQSPIGTQVDVFA